MRRFLLALSLLSAAAPAMAGSVNVYQVRCLVHGTLSMCEVTDVRNSSRGAGLEARVITTNGRAVHAERWVGGRRVCLNGRAWTQCPYYVPVPRAKARGAKITPTQVRPGVIMERISWD